jgi:hypothetical protein
MGMSSPITNEALQNRIYREILASIDRMAEQNRRAAARNDDRLALIVAPLIALGGIAIGIVGLMVAFARH